MLSLEVNKRVKGAPEKIWKILTDIESFAETAPNVTRVEHISGEGLGMVRRIHHNSGRSWLETCKDWEPLSRFIMEIDTEDYPLPVTGMRRIVNMEQTQNSVVIKIRYEYSPKYGPLGFLLDKYHVQPVLKIFVAQLAENLKKKINQQSVTKIINASTILDGKDSSLFSITPETLISEACDLLTEKRIGCVMVLDQQGKIAGILSERDVVHGISDTGQPVLNKPVKEFMTQNVITSQPEDTLEMIMKSMSTHRFRHLPVVNEDEKLLGVISIGDVIKTRMIELEQGSSVMQQYIDGRKWREVSLQVGRDVASEEFS